MPRPGACCQTLDMDSAERLWDGYADTFDDAPDHGLRDHRIRAEWGALLLPRVPTPPSRVVDLGCGTGSLAVLLAERGHQVSGLDLSGSMVRLAEAKANAARVSIDFTQGDAACPPFESSTFDVVLARHVLWVFENPDDVLAAWLRLLRPGGRLILIEGRWSTGAGLTSEGCTALVGRHRRDVELLPLSENEALWGRQVHDERYLLLSRW